MLNALGIKERSQPQALKGRATGSPLQGSRVEMDCACYPGRWPELGWIGRFGAQKPVAQRGGNLRLQVADLTDAGRHPVDYMRRLPGRARAAQCGIMIHICSIPYVPRDASNRLKNIGIICRGGRTLQEKRDTWEKWKSRSLLRQEIEQFAECSTSVRDSEFLFRFQFSKSLAQWSVEEVGVVPEASCAARFIKDNAVRSSLGETKNAATLRQRDYADVVGGAAGGLVLDAGRNSALVEGRSRARQA